MTHKTPPRSLYSFNTFGSRPLFRYLLLEHRETFLKTLAGLNLSPEDVLQGQRILTGIEQATIFGLACQLRSTDFSIAFRTAKLHDIHDSGLPGLLARCCANFRDVCELHEKYYFKLDSEGVLARLVRTPETISHVFDKLAYAPVCIQEFAVVSTWAAFTGLSPEAKQHVVALEFPGTPEAHGFSAFQIAELENEFSTSLLFLSGRLAFTMRAAALDLNIPTVDPALKLLLEKKLRVLTGELLPDDADELRNQVLTALLELRSCGLPCHLESVASFMGVKQETLAYALRSQGISFQRIKEIMDE